MWLTQKENAYMTPYYQDPDVTIYHADNREALPQVGTVDHIITDPPYSDYVHNNHLSRLEDRQALGFAELGSDTTLAGQVAEWEVYTRRWIIMTCDWLHIPALHYQGFLKRFGVWRKPNGAPQFSGNKPGVGWEAVAVCHSKHHGEKMRWNGGGHHAVWTVNNEHGTKHPTQKPVKLYQLWIEQFTEPGDLILDPYMGSGTALVAARNTGRRAIGIEANETHCKQAVERLRQLSLLV
jgi:site-specific DNA-methyltransferase (adenine-specific)